jgi:S-adenosylmethionine-diacylglycerol 3-amino-3-carboxypropyl transferase
MSKKMEQVKLTELVFAQNWEDPLCDHRALSIREGETVMAITSGGCNVLGFLQFNPDAVYCIDINPAQAYLLELKIAAIRRLDFEAFLRFTGLTSCDDREAVFVEVLEAVSDAARQFWKTQRRIQKEGFIMNGRYDRFVKFAGQFLNLLQGTSRIEGLMREKTMEEQVQYYDEKWNTRRYKMIYKLLFNKYILARKGLSADYFHFDDGSSSFAESFYLRAQNAFRDLPIAGNYFLSLYVTGKYRNTEEVPDYMKEAIFGRIKPNLDRVQIRTGEAQSWLDEMPDESIDCFALSNICELMSEAETERLFKSVYRTARPGARVIFRNLMIPREVPESLRGKIIKQKELSEQLRKSDRSFVYGKVAAYHIPKNP